MSSEITVKERVRSFCSRRLIYEEDGELKIFEIPEAASFEELIERFETSKSVKLDPATGKCKQVPLGAIPEAPKETSEAQEEPTASEKSKGRKR